MEYEKLGRRDLNKILICNPPDAPHYLKALEERNRRNRFQTLIVSCTALLLAAVSPLAFGRCKNFAPQLEEENWRRLNTRNQQFENYKNDFRQFGQASQTRRSRNAEDMTDVQLMVVADQVVIHLEYMETIVEVYLKVVTKKDRLTIWPMMTNQVGITKKKNRSASRGCQRFDHRS